MPNSNEITSDKMLWERVMSLLVVGGERLGRRRRFADTGVATYTSRISIDSEIVDKARNTIPTKRNSVVISIARKAAKCRNRR
jgi:hypothetical protein